MLRIGISVRVRERVRAVEMTFNFLSKTCLFKRSPFFFTLLLVPSVDSIKAIISCGPLRAGSSLSFLSGSALVS